MIKFSLGKYLNFELSLLMIATRNRLVLWFKIIFVCSNSFRHDSEMILNFYGFGVMCLLDCRGPWVACNYEVWLFLE